MPWGPRSVQPYPSPPTFLPSKPPERLPPPAARSSLSSTRRSLPPPAARRPRAPTESLKWRVRCPEDQGRFRQANEADGGGGKAWRGSEREALADEAGRARRGEWRADQGFTGWGGARSGPGEHDYQPTRHFYPRERSPERERRREESSGTRWAPYPPPLPLAPASLPERPPSLLRVTPAGTFKDAFILLPAALASTRHDPATRSYNHREQQMRPPAQRAVWPSPPRERRDDRPSQVAPVRSRFVPRTPASTADSSWSDEWLPRDPQLAPRPPQPGPPPPPPPARQPLRPAGPRHGYAQPPPPPHPPSQQQAVARAPFPTPRKRPLVAPFVPVHASTAQRPLHEQAQPHPPPPSGAPMDPRILVRRAKDPPAPSLAPQTRLILGSLALLPSPAGASRPSSSSSSTTAASHLHPATPPPSVTLVALSPSPSPMPDPVALRSRLTSPSDPNPPWLAAALYGPSFEEMEWRKALHYGKKRGRENEEEGGVGKRRRTDEGREQSDEVWLDLGAWEARWKKRAEWERADGGRR